MVTRNRSIQQRGDDMKTSQHETIKVCEADSPEWHKGRTHGIGASEAAAACGLSKWASPLELYYRKRGELPPVEETRAMRIGTLLEPALADWFTQDTGIEIKQRAPGLYRHPEHSHILASPDAIIDTHALAEFKTINERYAADVLGEPFTDEIPDEWNIQAQQQMLVMGAELVWFGVWIKGGDVKVYQVSRHEKLIEGIVRCVTELWQRIQSGDPPPMQDHPSNVRLARELFREVEEGEIVEFDQYVSAYWEEYEALGKEEKRIKGERERLKARVMMELENAQAAQLPDGRFVRRKEIHKKAYTVPEKSYVDVRAVKKL